MSGTAALVLKRLLVGAAARSDLLTRAVDIVLTHSPTRQDSYAYLRRRFIANGVGHRIDSAKRSDIVARFERIDREVPIGTTPTDGLFLAEMLLNTDAPGAVVECGCYAGGSTAKLSIIAKLVGREMVVFDSFEGLPAVDQHFIRDSHCRRSNEWVSDWTAGRYAERLEKVRGNVERFGEASVCRYVKGWFHVTMTSENLSPRIGFAFVDVDLANSARDCFVAIWPLLTRSGVFVTHDVAYLTVLQELYNPALWRDRWNAFPPILFGAGYGLCNESPHIGYMVKGEGLSVEYLKQLTIDK